MLAKYLNSGDLKISSAVVLRAVRTLKAFYKYYYYQEATSPPICAH